MTGEEIVALFWRRDEAALRESELAYGGGCRALAGRILGSGEDAEECVNDAFLRAWNTIPPERPRNLRAFLAKLTRNLALDRLRARTAVKRGGGEAEAVLEELAEVLGGTETAESQVTARELGQAVDRFVHRLPRREADLLIRRCFFAEPIWEIAARYGMRPGSVKTALARVRKKLKHYLESEGYL